MTKIIHIVGARPNFMKAEPAIRALRSRPGVQQILVHTGQHYDRNMSDVFFEQLGMPMPDINLEVGSGSHARQTAETMTRFEPVVLESKPDWVLVYGDVNSTVAATLVCAKLLIPIAHVEAGLRSGDRTMPEEVNRLVTDQLANLLFTPSEDGNVNLQREGVAPEKIHLVGNLMIDTLVRLLPQAEAGWPESRRALPVPEKVWAEGRYMLVTLHRPSNVDSPEQLQQLIGTLREFTAELPVIFPVHPRTRQRLQSLGLLEQLSNFYVTDPVGYLDFLALQRYATLVVTDSGGIQEETTYLNVPCLTVRENTERPITVTVGSNILVGQDMERLKVEVRRILDGNAKSGQQPPLWDGRAGERVADVLVGA